MMQAGCGETICSSSAVLSNIPTRSSGATMDSRTRRRLCSISWETRSEESASRARSGRPRARHPHQAALAGQVFHPPVGFRPIGNTGRTYRVAVVGYNVEPRVAAAWQPNFRGGRLGRLFGGGKTVFRGGYWHFYDRLNGVQTAVDTLQAVGFGQSLLCLAPFSPKLTNPDPTKPCKGNSGTAPDTAMRIGTDGSILSLPPIPATVTPPVVPRNALVPGANISFVPNSQVQDPQWKPGSHNTWDFTIQRELPGKRRV